MMVKSLRESGQILYGSNGRILYTTVKAISEADMVVLSAFAYA